MVAAAGFWSTTLAILDWSVTVYGEAALLVFNLIYVQTATSQLLNIYPSQDDNTLRV